jgi:hypothetical protein
MQRHRARVVRAMLPAVAAIGVLAGCRDALDRRLAVQLLRVRSLIDAGKSHEARRLLEETDRRFGGLAAPQTVALAAALE